MSEPNRGVGRWLLPVGLTLLVVALVAIALARGPVELDPDSPEGTVQEYLQAINEERWDDAVAVIHPDWLGACESGDLSSFAPTEFTAQLGTAESFGGGFVEQRFTDIGGEAGEELPVADTTVEVTITHGNGGGLGSGWNEFVVFEMVDEDEFWWIGNDPWPYFIWNCRDNG